jgi:hypothetical protein
MGDSAPDTDVDVMEHLDVVDDNDPQGLVNTITEDTQSVPHSFEYHAGALNDEQRMVRQGVEEEFRFQATKDQDVDTVSINYSGEIRFRTYQLTPAMGAVRVVDDKRFRGDTVISVQTGGPVYIGSSSDIAVGGLNTILVTGSRTMRTRRELWVVVGVNTTIDVQEEFN